MYNVQCTMYIRSPESFSGHAICVVAGHLLSWRRVFRQRHNISGAGKLPFCFRRGAARRFRSLTTYAAEVRVPKARRR